MASSDNNDCRLLDEESIQPCRNSPASSSRNNLRPIKTELRGVRYDHHHHQRGGEDRPRRNEEEWIDERRRKVGNADTRLLDYDSL
jgi:hypothetical protein